MTISLQRLEQLIDAYGADAKRWPADERQCAQQLLAESAQARVLLQQATWLDKTLDSYQTPAFEQLSARILQQPLPVRLASVPAGARAGSETEAVTEAVTEVVTEAVTEAVTEIVERLLRWLVPPTSASVSGWWRPAALACLPLALGLLLGTQLELFTDTSSELYGFVAEETELSLISFADYAESF